MPLLSAAILDRARLQAMLLVFSSAFGQASMQLSDGVVERSFPYTVFLTIPLYLLYCDIKVYLTADAVAAVLLQAADTNIQIQCVHDLSFVKPSGGSKTRSS